MTAWVDFAPRPRKGTGLRKMADKACFHNALIIAGRHPERYRYAEGLAWPPGLHAVHHAWVVDEDGHAIDVTWPDPGDRYRGVVFDLHDAIAAVLDADRFAGPAFSTPYVLGAAT